MSVDSIYTHKIWNDYEISKMVDGRVPYPCFRMEVVPSGRPLVCMTLKPALNTRGRFLIDPDGVIQGFEVLSPPVGRNVNETIVRFRPSSCVRESKGTQATPSGWKPGQKDPEPGPELVGNVLESMECKDAFDE